MAAKVAQSSVSYNNENFHRIDFGYVILSELPARDGTTLVLWPIGHRSIIYEVFHKINSLGSDTVCRNSWTLWLNLRNSQELHFFPIRCNGNGSNGSNGSIFRNTLDFQGRLTCDRIQRSVWSMQWPLDPCKLHPDNTKCCSNRRANRPIYSSHCSTLPTILECLPMRGK